MTHSGPSVPQRAGEQHYETMTIRALAKLPVHLLAAPDCALFMWSTASHTPQALWLADQWGFRFSSKAFTWAKTTARADDDFGDGPMRIDDPRRWFIGMGYGTRRNTEDCWLFTRGAPGRLDAGVRELIVAPPREHSRKPDVARDRMARLYGGARCELFSRSDCAGWSAWGNEVGKLS